ncbi:unnamed protein product [Arctia plantaginis]|uniref:PH domain-containing protein n=1 Tax=Arctia plantaginis TaxID=874455 RepID=A0A8S1A8C6_ARCPL|nr:unnamed protein product [Arctia plantaginis]
MASGREEGPVYYREIQKNAYLKRIPNDVTGSKLRPLGGKKLPLKAMWTQFCVHNGRTPYLEQYPDAESPATLTHKPVWRACLLTARHVTASVKPHSGDQYDFLIDTDLGAVRMLAPDWESMQDWVSTLRNTLHELKVLSKGENVYCVPPVAAPPAPPRALARDPTSPLPPTPPTPPDRVPGIELVPTRTITEPTRQPEPNIPAAIVTPEPSPTETQPTPEPPQENIDISNWDPSHTFSSLPSTSQGRPESGNESKKNLESRKGVAKICGQNICLDDSLFKRTSTESDEEFFAEIDRMTDDESENDFKQRVVVSNEEKETNGESSNHQATNITVIQVSNKEPPHTAIPVLGPETDVFNFDFKQQVTITERASPNFVNIVNTEQNDYGTTFGTAKNESEYGHLSLTTTVNLTGTNDSNFENQPTSILTNHTTSNSEEVYERLCMASTSNSKPSPLPVKKLKSVDKSRKSSLPNLEVADSAYEYLFLSNNNTGSVSVTNEVNCNGESRVQVNSGSNSDPINRVRSVERSRSQNAYDAAPTTLENRNSRAQNNSPKREIKNENTETTQPQKPIWKRGLTELSLLTRLRSIGQTKKQDSPTRQDDNHDRSPTVTSPVKVVHRSRAENRVDSTRRRSSSLSNGQSPVITPMPNLISLRTRQAAALRAEQRRGAALVASISVRDSLIFADYDNQVWVSWWGAAGARAGGRAGDRVAALAGRALRSAARAAHLLHRPAAGHHAVDIHYHRVPLGKIYVITKRDQESIGLKLDGECNIVRVEANSGAARAGLPPPGHWALTEINNRPINLLKGGEDDMNRLSRHGTEVSVLIQPSALVKKLRSALKGNKTLLGLR